MRGYVKLSNHEMEALHSEAKRVISSFADSQHNPDLGIVPYTDVHEGQNFLSCRFKGVNRIRLVEVLSRIAEEFPGADVMLEATNAPVNLYLELPIVQAQDYSQQQSNERRFISSYRTKKPSTEWGMFLFMMIVVFLTVIWYRFSVGISGF